MDDVWTVVYLAAIAYFAVQIERINYNLGKINEGLRYMVEKMSSGGDGSQG